MNTDLCNDIFLMQSPSLPVQWQPTFHVFVFFRLFMWCSLTGEVCVTVLLSLYTGFWLHSSMRYAKELT